MTLDEDPMPLLECFKRAKHPLTITDLERMIGLGVSTLNLLLLRLVRDGWILERTEIDRSGLVVTRYRLRDAIEDVGDSTEEWREERVWIHAPADQDDSERSLARTIDKGRPLSQEEQLDLLDRIQQGDAKSAAESEAILWECYLPWLSDIARSICLDAARHQDLVQVGTEAFLSRLRHFDLNLGTPISAYSYLRVRGSMLDYLSKEDQSVPLPDAVRLIIRTIGEATEKLQHRLEREPTIQEVANETGLLEETVRFANHAHLAHLSISLDEPSIPEVLLRASESFQPEHVAEVAHLFKSLKRAVLHATTLDDREKIVLTSRYLNPSGPKVWRQVAAELGISITRARQIEARAIKKLREEYGEQF